MCTRITGMELEGVRDGPQGTGTAMVYTAGDVHAARTVIGTTEAVDRKAQMTVEVEIGSDQDTLRLPAAIPAGGAAGPGEVVMVASAVSLASRAWNAHIAVRKRATLEPHTQRHGLYRRF